MAFADRVLRPSVELYFYLRISGLGQVWTTTARPWGAATTVIDGETYEVVPTLMADGLDATIEEGMEPWAGVDKAGSMSFRLVADSTWLDYLSPYLYRGNVTELAADLLPTTADIPTTTPNLALTWPPKNSIIYLGTETIRYDAPIADEFTGTERGRWGSTAQVHRAVWDGVDEVGYVGPFIADHPLTHAGRIVELWVGTRPAGAAACSAEDMLVYRGIVESAKLSTDLKSVDITSQSILRTVDEQAGRRLPQGDLDEQRGVVTVDDWSRECAYTYSSRILQGVPTSTVTYEMDLAPVGRLASFREVEEALFVKLQLATASRVQITEVGLEDGVGIRLRVYIREPIGDQDIYRLRLRATQKSIWRELGFVEDVSADVIISGESRFFEFFTDDPRPLVRLPVGARRPIWYRRRGTLDFVQVPGLPDAYGGTRGPAFRLGDQLAGLGTRTSGTVNGVRTEGVVFTDFAPLGSTLEEELVIRHSYDADYPTLVQGFVMDRMEWPRAIAYLLAAGARTSEQFSSGPWFDCAGRLAAAYLDEDSFAEAAEGADTVTIAVFEPTAIRSIIEPILVTYQHQILVRDGRLTLVEIPLGIVSEDPVVELTQADILTPAGIDWDIPTDLIVAAVSATNLGYDHAAGKGRTTRTLVQGAQLATWPASTPLEVDMASQPSLAEGRESLSRLADSIWPRWGGPFLVVSAEVNSGWGWLLKPGDAVALSHVIIPDPITTLLGVEGLEGWVYRTAKRYRGSSRSRLTILVPAIDGTQMTGWAPAARSTSVVGAAVACEPHRYRWTGGAVDAAAFEPGDLCYVYPLTDYTAGANRTVLSVVGNTVTFTAAVGIAHPVEIEYREYSACTDEQKRLAFMGTGSPPSIGGAQPYHYG